LKKIKWNHFSDFTGSLKGAEKHRS